MPDWVNVVVLVKLAPNSKLLITQPAPSAPSPRPSDVPKWTMEQTTSSVTDASNPWRHSAADLTNCSNLLTWFFSGGQLLLCKPPLRTLQKRIFCQRIRILFFQSPPKAHALMEKKRFKFRARLWLSPRQSTTAHALQRLLPLLTILACFQTVLRNKHFICAFCVVPSEMLGRKQVYLVYIVLCFKKFSTNP